MTETSSNFTYFIESIILVILTLWHGLALKQELPIDTKQGHFNTLTVRLAILGGILLLQVYLTFNVINQEIARVKESKFYVPAPRVKPVKKEKPKKIKKYEDSYLPEVDQNINKNLRKQKTK